MACSMSTHLAKDFENLAGALATFVSSPLSNLAQAAWPSAQQTPAGKCTMKVGKSDGTFAETDGNDKVARRFQPSDV